MMIDSVPYIYKALVDSVRRKGCICSPVVEGRDPLLVRKV
jgi:hypothetical protein